MQAKEQEQTTATCEQHSPAVVEAELQRQPHILMKLAENSLTVAQSIRDNYFRNTARFVSDVRRAIAQAERGERAAAVLQTETFLTHAGQTIRMRWSASSTGA